MKLISYLKEQRLEKMTKIREKNEQDAPPLTITPPGPSVTRLLAGTLLFFFVGAPVTGGAKMCVWYVCTCPGAGSGPGGEVTWAAG